MLLALGATYGYGCAMAVWLVRADYHEHDGWLRKALRAVIDEGAWSALDYDDSRPFPLPETGKFAVKVINHYGDEVLKVFDLS